MWFVNADTIGNTNLNHPFAENTWRWDIMLLKINRNKMSTKMTQDRRTIKKTRMKLQKSAGSTALLRVMYIPLVVFMIRNVISIKGKITQNTHMAFYFATYSGGGCSVDYRLQFTCSNSSQVQFMLK